MADTEKSTTTEPPKAPRPRNGTTTGIALGLLGAALRSSGKWCTACDHRNTQEGMNQLATAINLAAKGLDLRVEVKTDPKNWGVSVRSTWTF